MPRPSPEKALHEEESPKGTQQGVVFCKVPAGATAHCPASVLKLKRRAAQGKAAIVLTYHVHISIISPKKKIIDFLRSTLPKKTLLKPWGKQTYSPGHVALFEQQSQEQKHTGSHWKQRWHHKPSRPLPTEYTAKEFLLHEHVVKAM